MNEFDHFKFKINLSDIKSSFIIKNVFSFLSIQKILNIIIYKREFQKKLSVDIKDYKEISGKYQIVEKSGKGREYIINSKFILILIFEGEYLNGKRNGKGKEYYDNGKLEFGGEYLNGKGKE